MVDNSRKLPLGRSLLAIARQKALDHIHATGQKLPGRIVKVQGSIVTIAFDVAGGYNLPQVVIPIVEALYSRGGHQVGDKGFAAAANVTTSNASGLGPTGAPGLAAPGNLAALHWEPMGHVQWPDTGGNRISQGPAGAVSMTLDGKNQVAALPGKVVLQAGGVSVAITPQMIAQLAKLLGTFSLGGGAGGASGGGDGSNSTTTGSGNMATTQLLLAYQYIQPLTGATVTIPAGVVVTTVDPAGTLAALTIALPSPTDAQVQFVNFTQAITSLTWSGGTLSNAPASAPAGAAWTLQYQAASGNWFLI